MIPYKLWVIRTRAAMNAVKYASSDYRKYPTAENRRRLVRAKHSYLRAERAPHAK